jgi:hypothetical protein
MPNFARPSRETVFWGLVLLSTLALAGAAWAWPDLFFFRKQAAVPEFVMALLGTNWIWFASLCSLLCLLGPAMAAARLRDAAGGMAVVLLTSPAISLALLPLPDEHPVANTVAHYFFMLVRNGAPAIAVALVLVGLRLLPFNAGARRARSPVLAPAEGLAIYRQGYLALFFVLALALYFLELDGFLLGFKEHSPLGERFFGQTVTAAASGLVLGWFLAQTPYLLVDVARGWALRLVPSIALLHSVGWCVFHPLRTILTAAESWGRLALELGVGFAANLIGVTAALLLVASLRGPRLIFSMAREK